MVPGVAGAVVGVLPDADETGVGATGDVVGVVAVWVGANGDAEEVELGCVVPGVAGAVVGALPAGDEPGAEVTGDDVGAVDVGAGSIGEATGVGDPVVGAEVDWGGEAGVDVGVGGWVVAPAGTTAKRNAFPLLSTAAHEEPEKHETAFRSPRRSSSVGVDHPEPSEVT